MEIFYIIVWFIGGCVSILLFTKITEMTLEIWWDCDDFRAKFVIMALFFGSWIVVCIIVFFQLLTKIFDLFVKLWVYVENNINL